MNKTQMTKIYLLEPTSNISFKDKISGLAMNYVIFLASSEFGLSKEFICIERGKYGKQYINNHEECQFNISYTEGMIAIAVSDQPVGVDVERIRIADMRISKRFLPNREMRI